MAMTNNEPCDRANQFLDTDQVLELLTQVRNSARDAKSLPNATGTV